MTGSILTLRLELTGNESEAVQREHAAAMKRYWSDVKAVDKQKADWPKQRQAELQREFPNHVIDNAINQLYLICDDIGVKVANVPGQYGALDAIDLAQWITTYTRQCFD